MCYPNWIDSPYPLQEKTYKQESMISPIIELTIGDMYRRTPGFLSSVTMTVQDGSTWEFEEGMKLPHYVQISCEFTYIGRHKPELGGKHFELDWVKEEEPDGRRVNLKEFFSEENVALRKAGRFGRRADRAFDRGNRDKEGRLLDKANEQWNKILGFDDDSDEYNMFD